MTTEPPSALSRVQLAEIDRRAVEVLGLPSAVLMENAGRGAAERVLELLADRGRPRGRVAIVCGPGNNGGDGYVTARHLALAGCAVDVVTIVDPASLRGDAALHHAVAARIGIPVEVATTSHDLERCVARWRNADAIVDAVLGTGAVPPPRPHAAAAIEAMNACGGPAKVALDLPSGMDADTGAAPGPCFRADLTVTFAAPKLGFAAAGAGRHLGRVVVATIGVPVPAPRGK